ncbi:MAG: L-threonylcarbamoyladenylate synthase [Defluviitaleaceae bacterium]|nr:L-threonylcarbamoyladenylate synthase [Defluviitaleaceae bacterium]
MKTVIGKVEVGSASVDTIKQAAEIIKKGGLVAFPTETVYGLGANALDEAAAGKIYFAKGRPADNPLIVHVNNDFDLERIVQNVPAGARALMDAFWPGALTLVMKSRAGVFSYGHLDTVAIRVPNHIVAKLLIHHSGVPIAAPSANTSGRPSPTSAQHVMDDLGGKIDMILDGGACKHGLESTVIDFSEGNAKILRSGAITLEMIENAIGRVGAPTQNDTNAPKSPGMKYKHYSPKAKVTLVKGEPEAASTKILELLNATNTSNPVIIAPSGDKKLYGNAPFIGLGRRMEEIAANLYAVLRQCDENGHDEIFAQGVAEEGIGTAIMDRLYKAATK